MAYIICFSPFIFLINNFWYFILDKLNYVPLMSPESVLSANGDNISPYHQGNLKRPRTEDYDVGLYHPSKPTNYICSEARSFSRCKNSFIYIYINVFLFQGLLVNFCLHDCLFCLHSMHVRCVFYKELLFTSAKVLC